MGTGGRDPKKHGNLVIEAPAQNVFGLHKSGRTLWNQNAFNGGSPVVRFTPHNADGTNTYEKKYYTGGKKSNPKLVHEHATLAAVRTHLPRELMERNRI